MVSIALAFQFFEPVAAAGQATGSGQQDEEIKSIFRHYYPAKSLKLGEEGDVHFLVELNRDGKLHSCTVTKSSGYPRLDQATCDMIVATAYFRGAERDGVRKLSSHEGTVAWRLPPGHSVPKPAAPVAAAANVEPIICKRTLRLGSLYLKEKRCLTETDWKVAGELAEQEVRRLQQAVIGRMSN